MSSLSVEGVIRLTSQFDWTAVLAIGSLGTFALTLYRWYWVPRNSRINRNRLDVYRPLCQHIEDLIEWVKHFNADAIQQNAARYDNLRERLPRSVDKALDAFLAEINEYIDWYAGTKACIDLLIQERCNQAAELVSEYEKYWGQTPGLAGELSQRIAPAVIGGTQITKSWITDNTDFFSKMEQIQKNKNFDEMIRLITSDVGRFPIKRLLARLLKSQKEVLDLGQKTGTELKRRC